MINITNTRLWKFGQLISYSWRSNVRHWGVKWRQGGLVQRSGLSTLSAVRKLWWAAGQEWHTPVLFDHDGNVVDEGISIYIGMEIPRGWYYYVMSTPYGDIPAPWFGPEDERWDELDAFDERASGTALLGLLTRDSAALAASTARDMVEPAPRRRSTRSRFRKEVETVTE